MNHIGHAVRSWRGWNRMTQQNLAYSMSLAGFAWTRTTVAKVENGDRQLLASELLALLEVWHINLDQFTSPMLVTNP